MKQRCGNTRFPSHVNVSYTPDWDMFENFLRDMGLRPAGKTLDRRDPFGGYDKANCRWATDETQTNNRRNTLHLVYQPHGLHVVGYVTVVVLPGDTSHFHWARSGEYVTQATAIGPQGFDYVDTGDDPRNADA